MAPTPSSGGRGSAEAILAPARDTAITPATAMLQVLMASPCVGGSRETFADAARTLITVGRRSGHIQFEERAGEMHADIISPTNKEGGRAYRVAGTRAPGVVVGIANGPR